MKYHLWIREDSNGNDITHSRKTAFHDADSLAAVERNGSKILNDHPELVPLFFDTHG